MRIPQEMPLYRIIHNHEDESTLFLGVDVIANFHGAWGNEYADVAFVAKAARSHDSLVAVVQQTLGLLPEMRLTALKAEQLKMQLEKVLGDAMQEVHVICPDKLKRRKK